MEKGYAVVTGGDSGIGREIALELSRRGYKLVLVSLDHDKLEAMKKEVDEPILIETDLSKIENCYDLLEKTKDLQVDVYVNNAGFGDFGKIEDTSNEKGISMFNVNCQATYILCKEFIKRFKKENRGQYLLATASSAAFAPAPYMSEYYASKAFVLRLLLGYRQELIDSKANVNISILCPGPVKTNFEKTANVKFTINSLTADYVGKYAVKKMFKKKTVIVPGFLMKITHMMSKMTNEKIACKILDKTAKNPDHVK